MTFYERLESLRKESKISQGKLEKELGFSNGLISKWKNSVPSHDRLKKLADYFGVSVDYLMTGEEKKKAERPKELYTKEDLELLALIKKLNEKQRNLIVETIKSFAPQND